MTRVKKYLDSDVLEAAQARVSHIFDIHDSVVVSFSGGKDSSVVLDLVRREAERRGRLPIDACFVDQEVVPDLVIEHIERYRQLDWLRLHYFAIPTRNSLYVLGKMGSYIQWDPGRPHVRPLPSHAITLPPGDTRILSNQDVKTFMASRFAGRVAMCAGVRAAESLQRFHSLVARVNENYIGTTALRRAWTCRPIYDWEENDVLKYLHDHDIAPCPIYQAQHHIRMPLRVSTSLNAEQSRHFEKLAQVDPIYYDRLMQVFPHMEVQKRYQGELAKQEVDPAYGESFAAVRRYVMDHIKDPHQRALAFKRIASAEESERRHPSFYTPDYVLMRIAAGSFRDRIQPNYSKKRMTKGLLEGESLGDD